MNKFEIVNRGYEVKKVDAAIDALTQQLAEKDKEIQKLDGRVAALMSQTEYQKEIDAMLAATAKSAAELKMKAGLYFDVEISRLRLFREKWRKFAEREAVWFSYEQRRKAEDVTQQLQAIYNAYEQDLSGREFYAANPGSLKADEFDSVKKLSASSASLGADKRQVKKGTPHAIAKKEESGGAAIKAEEIAGVKESLEELCQELGLMNTDE